MLVLFSRNESNTRLPSFLRPFTKRASVTCSSATLPSTTTSRPSRTRESSYASTNSSQSQASASSISSPIPKTTIHQRRTLSRTHTSSALPLPPSLDGFTEFFQSRTTPLLNFSPRSQSPHSNSSEVDSEQDLQRWKRMLTMQRDFRCYRSARLEAAVQALDNGARFEDVPIPSRLCLDLIDEELKAQTEGQRARF